METIGTAATTALAELTDSPQSSARSLVAKPMIRMPTTIEECRALKVWAESVPATVEPISPPQLAKHLSFMAATLPSRSVDDETGKMRFAVYVRILGRFSNEALAYMARTACETLDWFPTPKQCLAIIEQYREPLSERDEALRLCARFTRDRFDGFIAALAAGAMTDEEVNNFPEQWKRIAVEQGHLLLTDDGTYALRPARLAEAE